MPKCGSSALQSFLSTESAPQSNQNKFIYVVVTSKGELLYGKDLNRSAKKSSYGYATSAPVSYLNNLSVDIKNGLIKDFLKLGSNYEFIILSNEGWGQFPENFSPECFLSHSKFNIAVLGYVRPQISWMNSAWWQWGAWSSASIDKWILRNKKNADWYELERRWHSIPWVNEVYLRLHTPNIVYDFLSFLNLPKLDEGFESNGGLSKVILSLYLRNRKLRPGPHDSAIDFILRRHLYLPETPPPWVISRDIALELMDYYHESNKNLLNLIPAEQRNLMLNDERWWDYDETAVKLEDFVALSENLDIDMLEKLAVSAIEALVRLESEIQELRDQIASRSL